MKLGKIFRYHRVSVQKGRWGDVKLTEKQKRFVAEYIKDYNATQAAIRAGYSEQTAYSQGNRLLKKVEIKKAIKELQEEIRKENIAEAIEVEEFLSLAMRGEIEEEVVVTENIGDYESRARIIKKQLSAKERIRAAELLGKRYALFTEKVDMDVDVGTEKLDSILRQLKGD